MKVPLSEALLLSVLGMVIVFIVLVFLMAIIYLLTVIIKRRKNKTPADTNGRPA